MQGEPVSKKLGSISNILARLGAVALFAMMLLTTADVLGRYLFNTPILGAFELTEFFVLILIFSFIGHTQSQKGHVSVDLFFNKMPKKTRLFVEVAITLICLAVMVLIAWMSGLKAFELKAAGQASTNLGLPKYPFAWFVVLGCLVMCVEYVRDLIQLREGRKEGKTS